LLLIKLKQVDWKSNLIWFIQRAWWNENKLY